MNDGKIRNPKRIRQVLAFQGLMGIFPRCITPTDVDFCVEIDGHFLIGEFKRQGASVPVGQRMALERLIKRLGAGSVAFVAQHTTDSHEFIAAEECRAVEWIAGEFPQWQPCNCSVEAVCRQWFDELRNYTQKK